MKFCGKFLPWVNLRLFPFDHTIYASHPCNIRSLIVFVHTCCTFTRPMSNLPILNTNGSHNNNCKNTEKYHKRCNQSAFCYGKWNFIDFILWFTTPITDTLSLISLYILISFGFGQIVSIALYTFAGSFKLLNINRLNARTLRVIFWCIIRFGSCRVYYRCLFNTLTRQQIPLSS